MKEIFKIIIDLYKNSFNSICEIFERPNGFSKEALEIMNNYEKKYLLIEMEDIFKKHKNMDLYPNDLYTLMCGICSKHNITYNLDLHHKLLDLCIAKMRSEEIFVKNKKDYNY